jgi:peptidyl-prolyl cis-trans isomerase SurA
MAKIIKLISLSIFFLPTIFLPYAYVYGETAAPADRIVAIVNKESITQSEADAFLNLIIMQLSQRYQGKELEERVADEKKELIGKMIEERIILQEAKRKKLQARADMVQKRIQEAVRSYGSDIEFQQSLRLRGLTQSDLEKRMGEQMMIRGLIEQEVRSKIVISPDEVTVYYEKHKDDFLQPEMRSVESLYFEDENITEKLTEDLKTGEDFKQLAERYKVAYAKDALSRRQLRPEIQEAIFSLRLNEVSGALKLNKGIYVFKLLEIHPQALKDLADVHEWIYNYIFEQKLAVKLIEWIEELKSKAYIVVK